METVTFFVYNLLLTLKEFNLMLQDKEKLNDAISNRKKSTINLNLYLFSDNIFR